MRKVIVSIHSYIGLVIAIFMVITGLTGAVISWDHEIDEWLNSHLTNSSTIGTPKDPVTLAQIVENNHPKVNVVYIPMQVELGHTLDFWVEPKVDPTSGELYEVGFNQVFVDPVSGLEMGKREWGAVWPITTENFVSFLYKLHYSLHFPEINGNDRWGIWFLGIIAIFWMIGMIAGLFLTFPRKSKEVISSAQKTWFQRWKSSWRIKTRVNTFRTNFDLHRSFGLWSWGVLFIVAFTAFSLNLYREVFFPMMSTVSQVTPTPYDVRQPVPENHPIKPTISFSEAVSKAQTEAKARGWDEPVGNAFYASQFGIYSVEFFHSGDEHGSGGVGHREIYLDGQTGGCLGQREPWVGTAADIFVQAQFPMHSGRILGLPGRILISIMGIVVTLLSITGIYIWWRKRYRVHDIKKKGELNNGRA